MCYTHAHLEANIDTQVLKIPISNVKHRVGHDVIYKASHMP